jgi:hypothetical protein
MPSACRTGTMCSSSSSARVTQSAETSLADARSASPLLECHPVQRSPLLNAPPSPARQQPLPASHNQTSWTRSSLMMTRLDGDWACGPHQVRFWMCRLVVPPPLLTHTHTPLSISPCRPYLPTLRRSRGLCPAQPCRPRLSLWTRHQPRIGGWAACTCWRAPFAAQCAPGWKAGRRQPTRWAIPPQQAPALARRG